MTHPHAALQPRRSDEPTLELLPLCSVVGMGASAGGLEALTTFFSSMPPDSGIALVPWASAWRSWAGPVTIESTPECGTTVVISLPLPPDTSGASL